jgi:2-(1,2-epoxy-1,2-dihydrophenyl)acetyl-CoA isomerase
MTYTSIKLDISNGLAVLALARPERKNAFDISARNEIAHAVARVKDDESVRALILTGEGGDFCSGGDLRAMTEGSIEATAGRERMRAVHRWARDLIELDRPVIAAVDGVAFGAGFSLALTADIVIATPRARFCMSFMRVGLVPDCGAFYTLPRAVGVQRAKELMLSARVVDADEAVRLGIALELVAPEQLMTRARAIAASFVGASSTVVSLVKDAFARSSTDDLQGALHFEAAAQGVAFSTDYHRTSVRDFLAKKPLKFNWPAG